MNFTILGAGGIGYHLAESLARLICYPPESAKGSIVDPVLWIVDGDVVEDHNLGRQHGAQAVDKNKAEVLAQHLVAVFPTLEVRVVPFYISDRLLVEHRDWLKTGITLFGCVDNNVTRCFIEGLLDKYDDFTWVDGGNDLDSGQAMLWRRIDGTDVCAPLTARNPEMRQETPGNEFPDQKDCTQEWPHQPQLALANQAVAQAMLQLWFSQVLTNPDADPIRFNTIEVDVIAGSSVPLTQHSLLLV